MSYDELREGSSDAERVRRQHPADRPVCGAAIAAQPLHCNNSSDSIGRADPGSPLLGKWVPSKYWSCAPNQHMPNRQKVTPPGSHYLFGSPFWVGVGKLVAVGAAISALTVMRWGYHREAAETACYERGGELLG